MFAPIQTGSGGHGMMIKALAEKSDFYETVTEVNGNLHFSFVGWFLFFASQRLLFPTVELEVLLRGDRPRTGEAWDG
jgi:hypothetical protein